MIATSVELVGADEMRDMLSSLPRDIQRELRPRMRQAGELVAGQSRVNASWSSRIPGAVSVRTSFGARTAGATVVVSAARAPHARAYEGINGNTTYRHPVYGRGGRGSWTWVAAPTRPYLVPAARSKEREAALLTQDALRAALPR